MKKIQGTKLKSGEALTGINNEVLKTKMPLVKCSCGAKILLVPDVAAMSLALKNHAAKHVDADEQFLIGQIFNLASKQLLA
jgi:hypothetical protein